MNNPKVSNKPKWTNQPRANVSQELATGAHRVSQEPATGAHTQESSFSGGEGAALAASQREFVKKSDLDALIKALKESNSSGTSCGNSFQALRFPKPLIVDSGASHHMISDKNLINNVEPALGNVIIANGDKIPIKGIGNLRVFDKKSKAFYMPNFTSNLLSVKRATSDLNCYAIFGPNEVYFQDIETNKVLGKGVTKDDLYVLEDMHSDSILSSALNSCLNKTNSSIWHSRLGHPHSRALELLLPSMSFENNECEACILGKHCKSVFPKSSTIYEHCFDLIHSDVWTSPCASRDNHKYFVTFIDQKSKYTWITLLATKDKVLEAFRNFQTYVTNHYNAKIKVFRSDNGGEYTSHAFKEHLAKHGILHQTSCPYTPQQNGVAERKNRHLMEVARCMLFHYNVPKRFWGDAVVMACYLINRIPTKILDDLSPFEVLNQIKPLISHLRVFGCVCYVHVPGEQRNKLEAKSVKAMFIGYSTTQKGYKCYVPETRKVLISRDVKFMETQGFYEGKDWESLKDLSQSVSDRAENLRHLMEKLGIPIPPTQAPPPIPDTTQFTDQPEGAHLDSEGGQESEQEDNAHNQSEQEEQEPVDNEPQAQEEPSPQAQEEPEEEVPQEQMVLRRSTRERKPASNWINTRVYYNAQAVAHPQQVTCSMAYIPLTHQAFVSAIDQDQIPKTYDEAKHHKVWREAVSEECKAMDKNHTWVEAELPKDKKTVSSRWVFTIKYKSNGEIERYKARLVARGFTQTYGEDYRDTFASLAKLHTVILNKREEKKEEEKKGGMDSTRTWSTSRP